MSGVLASLAKQRYIVVIHGLTSKFHALPYILYDRRRDDDERFCSYKTMCLHKLT